MKKVALSLASVLVATAFAPEASAIPAFARQTGMACQACHFQHFPLLNAFGRAFKSSGFTMMGAQGKVEGEHLSLPSTLNMSGLVTAGVANISKSGAINTPAGLTQSVSDTFYFTPNSGGEMSLFFGGHVTENIGFLTEWAPGAINPNGGVVVVTAVGTTPIAVANNANGVATKIPMLWDVGNGTRVGIVPIANNAPAYSFETMNTGAVSTHRLMGNTGSGAGTLANGIGAGGNAAHINTTSAAQYLGTGAGASVGVSAVVNGSWGFVNIGKYAVNGAAASPVTSNQLNTTYARGVFQFDAMGWDAGVGVQVFGGEDATANCGTACINTKATIVDGQMQGEAGGMPLGVYASFGSAQHDAVRANVYNPYSGVALGDTRRSFNLAAELGVIPHKATIQLALRSGKDGSGSSRKLVANTATMGDRDNAFMIGGTYELAQNVELSLTHTTNSGDAWNNTSAGIEPIGKHETTFLLEALF